MKCVGVCALWFMSTCCRMWTSGKRLATFLAIFSKRLYDAGFYSCGGWPVELGGQQLRTTAAPVLARHGGIYADGRPKLSEYVDYIFCDELAKVATGGLFASLFTYGIALPPIVATLGKSHAKFRGITQAVLTGQKSICLCITEPNGGSDVANIQTT